MTGRAKGSRNERFHKWTPEQRAYLAEVVPGRSHAEIHALVIERFGIDLTIQQVKAAISRYKLNTGRTGRFEKGREPSNKGRKGYYAPGCEKGWFKGGFSHNRLPLGTEKKREDGYLWVKVQDGHKNANWTQKHVLVWEETNGPIPRDHCLLFVDGDTTNCAIENLILIERKTLVRLNQSGLLKLAQGREAVESAVAVAKLHNRIGEATRRQKNTRRRRRAA